MKRGNLVRRVERRAAVMREEPDADQEEEGELGHDDDTAPDHRLARVPLRSRRE